MNFKRIATWAAIIFVAYYVLTQPNGAAGFVHNVLDLLKQAGSSMATFLNSL
jgi:hypothetical protein